MIILVSGPSAVGKNFVCERAAELGYPFLTPLTTRQPRTGETAADYEFTTVTEFHSMVRDGQLAEWDYAMGNYYGTRAEQIAAAVASETIYFLHILGRMGLRLKSQHPDRVWCVMLLSTSEDILVGRLQDRGFAEEEIRLRQQHIQEEIGHAPLFDQVIPEADSMEADSLVFELVSEFQRELKRR